VLPTIDWQDDAIVMVDQRKLPAREIYVRCETASDVARAIRTMVIRGAPAIGVAAAMGIALGMQKSKATGTKQFVTEFQRTCDLLAATRPTAVNLFWAIDRMKRAFAEVAHAGGAVATSVRGSPPRPAGSTTTTSRRAGRSARTAPRSCPRARES